MTLSDRSARIRSRGAYHHTLMMHVLEKQAVDWKAYLQISLGPFRCQVQIHYSSTTVTFLMTTGVSGTSRIPARDVVNTFSMERTTFIPLTTLPNTQ